MNNKRNQKKMEVKESCRTRIMDQEQNWRKEEGLARKWVEG